MSTEFIINYIYKYHRNQWIHYAYTKVWVLEKAKDLFQDTMLELFEHGIDESKTLNEILGYAWNILRGKIAKSFRGKSYKIRAHYGEKYEYFEMFINMIPVYEIEEENYNNLQYNENNENNDYWLHDKQMKFMFDEINSMNDNYKKYIDLRLDGKTHKEIADICGWTKMGTDQKMQRIKKIINKDWKKVNVVK